MPKPAVAYAPLRVSYEGDAAHAHAYLYGEVGWEIDAKHIVDQITSLGDLASLTLHINSPGGAAYDGLALHNFLRGLPYETVAVVDGLAASAASVIAVGAKRVQMGRAALLMIHESYTYGDDAQKEKLDAALLEAYASRPGVDRDAVRAAMSVETWLSADDALALGLIDAVVEPDVPAAEEPTEEEAAARAAVRDRLMSLACARLAGEKPRIRVPAGSASAVAALEAPAAPEATASAKDPGREDPAAADAEPAPAEAAAAEGQAEAPTPVPVVEEGPDALAIAEAAVAAGETVAYARALAGEARTIEAAQARLSLRAALREAVARARKLGPIDADLEARAMAASSAAEAGRILLAGIASAQTHIHREPLAAPVPKTITADEAFAIRYPARGGR